jgi:hypothetical protein
MDVDEFSPKGSPKFWTLPRIRLDLEPKETADDPTPHVTTAIDVSHRDKALHDGYLAPLLLKQRDRLRCSDETLPDPTNSSTIARGGVK